MTFSVARQTELLNGQPAIARKVFEAVPMQEAWTCNQISASLQRQTRSSIQFRTLEGCMNKLLEAGLICEPKQGHFQRIAPREKVKAVPPTIEEPPPEVGAVEMLNELATRARRLADDIDAAAEVIGEQEKSNEEASRKLSQLQSILKSLA